MILLVVASVAIVALVHRDAAAADSTVFSDGVASGWQDWSSGGMTRDFAHTAPVFAGSRSIAVTYTGGWSGLQLGRNDRVDLGGLDVLRFRVHGGSSGGHTCPSPTPARVKQTAKPSAGK